jgi:hypothetical protein
MATFVHNIIGIDQAPKLLKEQLTLNSNINKGGYNLRINNHYGEATFVYFYSKFFNNLILEDLKTNFYKHFKKLLFNNLNNHFIKFCELFPKFDLWLNT